MAEPQHQQDCLICERVALWKSNENPYFIAEFENTIFVVGDHQFHCGYCLLLLKDHVRELHELSITVQQAVFSELMAAGRAIVETFDPWKMNYACYGNTEEHVHWHIFPRYASDPDRKRNPWLHSADFKDKHITDDRAVVLASEIRQNLGLR